MVFQLSFSMLQQDEAGKPLCPQLCVSSLSRHMFPATLAQSWLDTAMKPTPNPESGDGAPTAQREPFHLLGDSPQGARAGVPVWSVVPTTDTHFISTARGHTSKAQIVASSTQRGRGIHLKMLLMLSGLCANTRMKWLHVLDIQSCSSLDITAEIRPHGSAVALLWHFSSVQSCLPFQSW